MDQQTQQTIKPGMLSESCYKSEQERFEAFCRAMIVSAFIGPQGEKGVEGDDAETPEVPEWELFLDRSVPIPDGSVSVNAGIDLQNKILRVEGVSTSATTFAVGTVDGTTVWFVFQNPATAVDGTGFTLAIYSIRQKE